MGRINQAESFKVEKGAEHMNCRQQFVELDEGTITSGQMPLTEGLKHTA